MTLENIFDDIIRRNIDSFRSGNKWTKMKEWAKNNQYIFFKFKKDMWFFSNHRKSLAAFFDDSSFGENPNPSTIAVLAKSDVDIFQK